MRCAILNVASYYHVGTRVQLYAITALVILNKQGAGRSVERRKANAGINVSIFAIPHMNVLMRGAKWKSE